MKSAYIEVTEDGKLSSGKTTDFLDVNTQKAAPIPNQRYGVGSGVGQVQRIGAVALGGNDSIRITPNSVFTAANLPWAVGIDTTKSVYKAVIPQFLYKPSFGYPRLIDIPEIRRLSATPYVEMCIRTIIDEISAISWDIVPRDENSKKSPEKQGKPFEKPTDKPKDGEEEKAEDDQNPEKPNKQTEAEVPGGTDDEESESSEAKDHCEKVKQFFDNPNINQESFEEILKKVLQDILVIDSGVIVKVFDPEKRLREIYARDGGTITKNSDIFGTFQGKLDVIDPPWAQVFNQVQKNLNDKQTLMQMAEQAAYFQYGWTTGARPTPFGTREIIYMMRNPRPDSIYGRSCMETLAETIQLLVYGIDNSLDYYKNHSIPKGVITAEGADAEMCRQISEKLKETLQVKDEVGNYRRLFYKIPVIGTKLDFVKTGLSNAEMEVLAHQQWFSKIIWACFGITPSELGFTEDSNRATEFGQNRVFKRKAIRPLLKLIEYYINTQLISEFKNGVVLIKQDTDGEKKEEVISGIDDVKFQFSVEDIDEDLQKHQLYELQIRTGIKTKNEIREELGLEPIENGDGQNEFSFFNNPQNPFAPKNDEETEDKPNPFEKKPTEAETTGADEKKAEALGGPKHNPLDFPSDKVRAGTLIEMEHTDDPNIAQQIALDHLSEDINYYEKLKKMESKAILASYPMVLKPGEEMAKYILKPIRAVMSEWEKEIKKQLDIAIPGTPTIHQIKAINKDTILRLKEIIKADLLGNVVKDGIRNVYYLALDKIAAKYNQNWVPNQKAVEFMASHALDNIKDMTDYLKSLLRGTLERGLMAGDGPYKLKERITDAFDIAEDRAEMIARTETINAENAGAYEGYQQTGMKGKIEWIARIDERTCEHCKALNGKTVEIGDKFKEDDWQGFRPTRHPNCRCSIAFIPG